MCLSRDNDGDRHEIKYDSYVKERPRKLKTYFKMGADVITSIDTNICHKTLSQNIKHIHHKT